MALSESRALIIPIQRVAYVSSDDSTAIAEFEVHCFNYFEEIGASGGPGTGGEML